VASLLIDLSKRGFCYRAPFPANLPIRTWWALLGIATMVIGASVINARGGIYQQIHLSMDRTGPVKTATSASVTSAKRWKLPPIRLQGNRSWTVRLATGESATIARRQIKPLMIFPLGQTGPAVTVTSEWVINARGFLSRPTLTQKVHSGTARQAMRVKLTLASKSVPWRSKIVAAALGSCASSSCCKCTESTSIVW